jgi:hypothetical protein
MSRVPLFVERLSLAGWLGDDIGEAARGKPGMSGARLLERREDGGAAQAV